MRNTATTITTTTCTKLVGVVVVVVGDRRALVALRNNAVSSIKAVRAFGPAHGGG